jgi:hypothetical protein
LQAINGGTSMKGMNETLLLEVLFKANHLVCIQKFNKGLCTTFINCKHYLQHNFSYMALLRGGLDISCSYESANIQVKKFTFSKSSN